MTIDDMHCQEFNSEDQTTISACWVWFGNKTTVEPWNMDTFGTRPKCPVYRGIHYSGVSWLIFAMEVTYVYCLHGPKVYLKNDCRRLSVDKTYNRTCIKREHALNLFSINTCGLSTLLRRQVYTNWHETKCPDSRLTRCPNFRGLR